MTTVHVKGNKILLRDLKLLLAMTDAQLLSRAKADLATALADRVAGKLSLDDWAEFVKFASVIRFFREKTARSAGKYLAKFLDMAFSGSGDNHPCLKLNYCQNREKIKERIEVFRKAIAIGEAIDDVTELAAWLTTIIEFAHLIKIPLSVALLALLYAFDELCGCDKRPGKGNFIFPRAK